MPTASQLTADPALETSLFWDQYKLPIVALVAALVLGGLGFVIYQFNAQRQADAAAELLATAKTPQEYQSVIDRYSGSNAAASAYLLLAEDQRAQKKYAEANATLHKFIDQFPKHELITTAWMGVAANLTSLGKNEEALSTYQRLVAQDPQSYSAPLALLAELPLLKTQGRFDEARRVCETLLSQYRDNVMASAAIRELQRLPKETVKASPAKPAAAKKP